ncbi:ABC transporter permease [Chelativorans sp. AA-79]|uniref:ABC transporter permease n=1 Tax=Chelativorans sp. AA-79 TaxID=3028735 RepID=UPI0023F67C94|nr:ABC transporter permease [Chelativorans sp. AA-79]WEX08680.1 ABC transporter permease [Chelativorans sp. AA-79]
MSGGGLFTFRGRVSPVAEAAVGAAAALVLLAVWEACARTGLVAPQFLPAPSRVVTAFWGMLKDQNLLWHSGVSIARVWTAFLLAAVMAIPIGILMSSYRIVGAALEPVVDFIRYLPVPALVPLSIIWFGVDETTKIFLLWLGTFFQLVLLVADDMRRVPQEYVEVARTVGANSWHVMKDVALRSMGPSLLDNLRITLGWCWTYLIIAEIVAANSGIGYLIWTARRFVKTPEVMAGVFVIGLIGLVTDQLLRLAHRRLFPYL